jgi:hypothetical protein
MDHQAFAQLLGNYGEFVGAVAVVVTLAYLAIQIRQNSEQLRLNSYQTHLERHAGLISHFLQDPEKFATFQRALNSYDSCPPHQQAMFHSHVMTSVHALRHSQQLSASGVLPEGEFLEQQRDFSRVLKSPGGKEWMDSLGIDATKGFFAEVLRVGKDEPPLNLMLPFLRETDLAQE